MEDSAANDEMADFVSALGEKPFEVAIILGSGLGDLGQQVEHARHVPYVDIPFLPPTTVSGHSGKLILGELVGRRVAVFQGRFHLYEGHDAYRATVTVRLARALGCGKLLLSCAAGGIKPGCSPGDFMFVVDHLNLTGDNPLRGQAGDPFLDLSRLYNRSLLEPLRVCAQEQGVRLHTGVLAALMGPCYETPAEVRMVGALGGDAVSMSTVPEAIMGKYLGMDVAALALIANAAAGLSGTHLDHQDVLAAGRKRGEQFAGLVRSAVANWSR